MQLQINCNLEVKQVFQGLHITQEEINMKSALNTVEEKKSSNLCGVFRYWWCLVFTPAETHI